MRGQYGYSVYLEQTDRTCMHAVVGAGPVMIIS